MNSYEMYIQLDQRLSILEEINIYLADYQHVATPRNHGER